MPQVHAIILCNPVVAGAEGRGAVLLACSTIKRLIEEICTQMLLPCLARSCLPPTAVEVAVFSPPVAGGGASTLFFFRLILSFPPHA